MSVSEKIIDFSDMSGGRNTAWARHALLNNQVADCRNAIFEKIGTTRAPGWLGAATTALFNSPIRGLWTMKLSDGTEKLIAVSNKTIYNIDVSSYPWTATSIGSLSADTACYAVNVVGKLWIVNGTDFVKIEYAASTFSVYNVGIAAPTGTSAAAASSGTLPAGVYGCYVTYSRKISGQYLHSLPYSLGNVTVNGSQKITFTVPNSTDPQVTNKVVWMTDAGGSVPCYYGESDNTATAFDITSNASRNASLLMSTQAANNQVLPIAPAGIFTFDDKILVWAANGSTVYWSLKTDVNSFDLERFLAANFRTFSVTVNNIFSVRSDLFVNSIGNGVIIVPSGDMSASAKRVESNLWFLDCKSSEGRSGIAYHKGAAWGVTNDGVRYFDGEKFSEDLSFTIKPDIDNLINGLSSVYPPAVSIFRRSGKRTELRISYRDILIGSTIQNTQLVLNLDFYLDPNIASKTWEYWEIGVCDYCIFGGGMYAAQSVDAGGQIVRESGVADEACYNNLGFFTAARTARELYICSRTVIDRLDSETIFGPVYTLATSNTNITGNLLLFDANNTKFPFTIVGVAAQAAVLPADGAGGLPLPFIMQAQYPQAYADPVAFAARANSVTMEISQAADDPYFFIYAIQLPKVRQVITKIT